MQSIGSCKFGSNPRQQVYTVVVSDRNISEAYAMQSLVGEVCWNIWRTECVQNYHMKFINT